MRYSDTRFSRAGSPAIIVWLLVCVISVAIMVILGGMTRLTHSGLSMVEWQPLLGVLPPLSAVEWQEAFAKYQQYPEFKIRNPHMDLAGFKGIFWLEFLHRFWGRMIGVIFLLPFVFFMWRRNLSGALAVQCVLLFVLGAMQGLLGWFMVQSGLVDQPDVSHYRLSAHLLLAFVLYGWIWWLVMGLLWPKANIFRRSMSTYRMLFSLSLVLFLIVVMYGGFVAGTDAGRIYNTFPLMGDSLLPPDMFIYQPWIRNFAENIVTIQFSHRVLAVLLFVLVSGLCCSLILQVLPRRLRLAVYCLMAAVSLQLLLGIATLLLSVPVVLGVAHQAGALLLLTVMLWVQHELRS